MNVTGVKLEGFDEFLGLVKQLPDKMKAKAMKEIMKKNMKPIAAAIKANTPVRNLSSYQGVIKRKRKDGSISTESRPGNLKASIGMKTFGTVELSAYAGIQKNKRKDGWYGFFVERGTKTIGKRPFIAQAASTTIPLAAKNLTNDIQDYIVQNAKKLGLDAK